MSGAGLLFYWYSRSHITRRSLSLRLKCVFCVSLYSYWHIRSAAACVAHGVPVRFRHASRVFSWLIEMSKPTTYIPLVSSATVRACANYGRSNRAAACSFTVRDRRLEWTSRRACAVLNLRRAVNLPAMPRAFVCAWLSISARAAAGYFVPFWRRAVVVSLCTKHMVAMCNYTYVRCCTNPCKHGTKTTTTRRRKSL